MKKFVHDHDLALRIVGFLFLLSVWGSTLGQIADASENSSTIQSEEIIFYPNPAKDYIIISEPSEFTILNLVCKEVLVGKTTTPKEIIYLSDLLPGVHFIQFNKTGPWHRLDISRQ